MKSISVRAVWASRPLALKLEVRAISPLVSLQAYHGRDHSWPNRDFYYERIGLRALRLRNQLVKTVPKKSTPTMKTHVQSLGTYGRAGPHPRPRIEPNHNTTTQKKGKRGAVRRYCHVDCTLKALGLSLMGFFERLFLGAEAVTVPTYKIPGVNPRTPFFFFCLRRHFFS